MGPRLRHYVAKETEDPSIKMRRAVSSTVGESRLSVGNSFEYSYSAQRTGFWSALDELQTSAVQMETPVYTES